ncbi:MAG TPA: YceI family protein, partial [Bacteroidota bacterium]|nr:YceI family protein [Bacteroidota bacterium]
MNTRTLIIPLALLLGAVLACAQTPVQRIHFLVAPGSTLTLNGTSTLHSYECSADSLTGTIESDTSGLAHNMLDSVFIGGKVEIPVKVLNNSSDGLKKNMAEALKGADFPVISFVLTHCAAAPDTLKQPGVWQINTTGNLTIAGKT